MPSQKMIIGCGYLGRRVARHWVAEGDVVFALTRTASHADELRAMGVRPIVGDVLDPGSLQELPDVETVLYAVGLDRRSGRSLREVYVAGLENVLGAIAPRSPRVIYVSSTSVYGQNCGEWVDEASECQPETPNGQVCLEAEQLLRRFLPSAVVLRLAGLYGPDRLIARVEQLRSGVPLEGNPDAWLNLIHVEDAAAAVLSCERSGEAGETYLVADDRPSRRSDYYSLLASLIGAPAPTFANAPIESATPHPGLGKRCRNRRMREQLHVSLRYPTIAEGLPASIGDDAPGDRPARSTLGLKKSNHESHELHE